MLVSYNWLQEYFDKPLPKPEELAGLLNTRAFEIEGVEKVGDDYTIDVDVLPNRSHDCFSHYGIAKEISALGKIPIKDIYNEEEKGDFETKSVVKIEDSRCYRFSMAEVENPVVGPSPKELVDKLEVLGQRSINTIVDITNIVMLEMGQPMHAFDKDKVEGGNLIVRPTKKGEKLVTLDDQEVTFEEGDLAVADSEKTLSVAPIKGGKPSGVTESTKNILFEAASWNAVFARKISQRTGITTESGKRFEHEVSPLLTKKAVIRALELVRKYASDENTKISNVFDNFPRPPKHPYYVGTSLEEVNKRLGLELKEKDVEDIFTRLKFKYEKINARERFLETLKEAEGKPYEFGASVLFDAPERFDCSSLTAYASATAGQNIPRMVIDQYVWSDRVERDDLEPGDLVFSNHHVVVDEHHTKFKDMPELQAKIMKEHDTSQEFVPGTKIEKPIDHVGVYLGDGKVIHSTSVDGKGTVVEDLETSPHFKDTVGYGRVFEKDEERYVVTVADERLDLRISEDLSEEIGRVYGYEHLPEPEIASIDREPEVNKVEAYNNEIRRVLVDAGFSEIITPSFRTEGELKVVKSFADDRQYLREDLAGGMRSALDLNVYNADLLGLKQVKTFEIGKSFDKDGEKLVLCIGVENNKVKKPKSVEALKEAVEIVEGVVGEKALAGFLHRDTVVEIDLDKLYEKAKTPEGYVDFEEIGDVKYVVPSQYPFVLRDISVWTPGGTTEGDVRGVILEKSDDLLVRNTLVDVFEKDGKTSYSFRLVFQSDEKTLTDSEVNTVMDGVYEELGGKEGFEIR